SKVFGSCHPQWVNPAQRDLPVRGDDDLRLRYSLKILLRIPLREEMKRLVCAGLQMLSHARVLVVAPRYQDIAAINQRAQPGAVRSQHVEGFLRRVACEDDDREPWEPVSEHPNQLE